MPIDSGKLNKRLLIQALDSSRDSNGVLQESYEYFDEVWGALEYLSARDMVAAAQVNSKVIARATIRNLPGLLPSMRIVFRGKNYNIEGILPDKESGLEYMTLPVSEGVNEG